MLCLVTQSCWTLCDPMDYIPLGSSVHQDSPGKNTGVGCHALLQGIFPTQRWNPGLLHCRWILYRLSHQGNPGLLEWVAYPFSRGSSWPRNGAGLSCIAGRFFTSRVTGEAPHAAHKVKVTHSCPTLCDPMYYTVHGILQAKILEWVAFHFSRGSSQRRNRTQVFCIAGRFFTSWATRGAQYVCICVCII